MIINSSNEDIKSGNNGMGRAYSESNRRAAVVDIGGVEVVDPLAFREVDLANLRVFHDGRNENI